VRGLRVHPVWTNDVIDVWLDRDRDRLVRDEGPLVRRLFAGLGGAL